MDVKIIETGEIVSLTILDDNGIDWSSDLIGNAGATIDGQFDWDDDREIYTASRETVEWWQEYIAATEANELHAQEIADQLHMDKSDIITVAERLAGHLDGVHIEFNDVPGDIKNALSKIDQYSADDVQTLIHQRSSRPGRPPQYDEPMIVTPVHLRQDQREWLSAQPGGIAETVRRLVDAAMGVK